MFLKLFLLSMAFLAIAAAGFGIRMLIKRNSRFPDTHVSSNPEMQKRGLTCAQHIDTGCNPTDGFPGCSACRSYSI